MTKEELIYTATRVFNKGLDYETLKYSDDMYEYKGEELEDLCDKIFEYVEEIESYGTIAFKEKYKEFKMYYL